MRIMAKFAPSLAAVLTALTADLHLVKVADAAGFEAGETGNPLQAFVQNLSKTTLDKAAAPGGDKSLLPLSFGTGKKLVADAVRAARDEVKNVWRRNDGKRKNICRKASNMLDPRGRPVSKLSTTDGVARAWDNHNIPGRGGKGRRFLNSDLGKVVYKYMTTVENTKRADLISSEHLPTAVLAKSYVENIVRQYRAFNSLELLRDKEQRHIANTIANYCTRKNFAGPKKPFFDGGRQVQQHWGGKFKAELEKLKAAKKDKNRRAFANFPRMGGPLTKEIASMKRLLDEEGGSRMPFKKQQKRRNEIATNVAKMFQVTAWMPQIQGPMVLFRFGDFGRFRDAQLWGDRERRDNQERISSHFESTSAFFGKGNYEPQYDGGGFLDGRKDDLLIFTLAAGKSIPAIMVGRAFNAFEEGMPGIMGMPAVPAGANLLEVILPPGITSQFKYESKGWWGDLLFGKADQGAVFPHMPEMKAWKDWRGGNGKARVYELEGWSDTEENDTATNANASDANASAAGAEGSNATGGNRTETLCTSVMKSPLWLSVIIGGSVLLLVGIAVLVCCLLSKKE